MSAGAVIGREEELGEIRACLTRGRRGPCRARARRRARDRQDGCCGRRASRTPAERGYRVLAHRSVEAEAGFAFAGLSRSGRAGVRGGRRASSRRRRRAALEVGAAARRRGGPPTASRTPSDSRCSTSLRVLARRHPGRSSRSTTCSGWTRRPRRCCRPRCVVWTSEHVGLLATSRGTRRLRRLASPPWQRVRSLGPDWRSRAVHALLRDATSASSSPRPQLARLHELSGGNPFFALELARAHARAASRRACAICSASGSPISPLDDRRAAVGRRARPADRGPGLRRPRATRTAARRALEAAAGDVLVIDDGAAALRASAARIAVLRPRGAVAHAATRTVDSPTSSTTSRSAPGTSRSATTRPDAEVADAARRRRRPRGGARRNGRRRRAGRPRGRAHAGRRTSPTRRQRR